MTTPTAPTAAGQPPQTQAPANQPTAFSAEDATETALQEAFTAATAAWLSATAAAILAAGTVPNLSMMLSPAAFTAYAMPRIRQALSDVWLRVYARTGTDLRGHIEGYLASLPNRLGGLAQLANNRAAQALQEALSSGDVEKIRQAVQDALDPSAYTGYVNRLAQSEAAISVNSARHELATAAYREGVRIDKTWRTRRDARVRHTHAAAEGQTVPFVAPFFVGGIPMQHPGDPTAPVEEVVNCRCQVAYRLHRGRT